MPTNNLPSNQIPLPRTTGLVLISNTPKGRGVFTTAAIPAGTIIEVSPVLLLSTEENSEHIAHTQLYHYTYNWPTPKERSGPTTTTCQAIIFGLGSMFNHSLLGQNVGWNRDLDNRVIVYNALRDIEAGEELCISYGDRLTFIDVDGQCPNSTEGDEALVLSNIEL